MWRRWWWQWWWCAAVVPAAAAAVRGGGCCGGGRLRRLGETGRVAVGRSRFAGGSGRRGGEHLAVQWRGEGREMDVERDERR